MDVIAVHCLMGSDGETPNSLAYDSLESLNEGDVRKINDQQQMRAIPRLTEDEERALTSLVWREPDSPQAREAIDTLTLANLRLVEFYAKKSWGQGLDLDDLVQEGTLGLIKAIKDFNPASGNRLSTYAVNWIRQYIQRAIDNQGRSLRRPVNVQTKQRQLKKVTAELEQTLMRYPTRVEITQAFAERYGAMSLEALDDLLVHDPRFVSMDQPVEDDASSVVGDFVPDEQESASVSMHRDDLHTVLEGYLAQLPARSRQIVELLNGWNGQEALSLSRIADQLNLSRERIRQLNVEAMNQLRVLAQKDQLADYLHH